MDAEKMTLDQYTKAIMDLIKQGNNKLTVEKVDSDTKGGTENISIVDSETGWGIVIDQSKPYTDNVDVYTVALDVIKYIDKNKNKRSMEEIADAMSDFDKIKDNIYMALSNSELHDLSKVVHVGICNDISGIFKARFMDKDKPYSVVLTRNMLKQYKGINEEKLFDLAIKNMSKDIRIGSMLDVYLMKAQQMGEILPPYIYERLEQYPMFFISNKYFVNGAGYIFADNIAEELQKVCKDSYGNGKFITIPSSIHELLIIPESVFEERQPLDLDNIITDINEDKSIMPNKDVLSNIPFVFDANEKKLMSLENYLKDKEEQKER